MYILSCLFFPQLLYVLKNILVFTRVFKKQTKKWLKPYKHGDIKASSSKPVMQTAAPVSCVLFAVAQQWVSS